MNVNEILKTAIEEVKLLKTNEVFLVKDLFKGYEWNRISIAERLRLGILFINEIQNNKNLKIDVLNKTSSNQQKYKKL
jgi:hypothetical protein